MTDLFDTSPPDSLLADLLAKFAATTSVQEHLALVDQAPVRELIEATRNTPEWAATYRAIRKNYERFYQWPKMPEASP